MVYYDDMKLDRITIDPRICHGKACVRGMRMPVSLVLNLVASGLSPAQIIDEHPYLEEEDIRQCIRYAAWLAEEKTIEIVCETCGHAVPR